MPEFNETDLEEYARRSCQCGRASLHCLGHILPPICGRCFARVTRVTLDPEPVVAAPRKRRR